MSPGPRAATLTIEFTGYWLSGEGKGGAGLDDVTYRDSDRCPAMPMTQIKGQLRETAGRLWPPVEVEKLFGSAHGRSADDRSPLAFLGEARLPPDVRRWFGHEDNKEAQRQLFRAIAATRIDEKTGAAKDLTLRRIEVAVPLTLTGTIEWRGHGEPDEDWVERLDRVCAATIAFGKGKNDGLGRVVAGCKRLTEGGQ